MWHVLVNCYGMDGECHSLTDSESVTVTISQGDSECDSGTESY